MYEQFRNDIATKLMATAGSQDVQKILNIVDATATRYEIKQKQLSLVPYTYVVPELVKTYLMCRTIEGIAVSTMRHYELILNMFFMAVQKAPEDVTTNDIRAYLFGYQRQRGVSNRTLDGYRIVIHSFFMWATNEEYICKNPCAKIKPIKYIEKPRSAMDQIELEYIRNACRNAKDKAIIEVLYSTGCRVSELASLKKSDINWEKREITVLGKGSKYRTCYLNAKAIVALEVYLNTRKDINEHVFVTDRAPHHSMTKEAIERIVRIIYKMAGKNVSTHITPHVFRHTTATTALKNGMPVQDVQLMLGHANIATTMIYAEVNKSDVKLMHQRCVV